MKLKLKKKLIISDENEKFILKKFEVDSSTNKNTKKI